MSYPVSQDDKKTSEEEYLPTLTKLERKAALDALPGPGRTFFFGNVLQIDKLRMHTWVHEQALEYGPVMRISFFENHCVFISSWEAAVEAFVTRGSDCMGSRYIPRAHLLTGPDVAFTGVDAPHYADLRRCLHEGLTETHKLEAMQSIQRQYIVDFGERCYQAGVVNMNQALNDHISLTVASLAFGGKYESGDDQVKAIRAVESAYAETFLEDVNKAGILDLKTSLWKYTCIKRGAHRDAERLSNLLTEIIQKEISVAKEKYAAEESLRCVVDHMLHKQAVDLELSGSTHVTDAAIQGAIIDLPVGTNPLYWRQLLTIFSPLLVDQDLQKRLQATIDEHFRRDDVVTFADRGKLPFIESYIQECLRFYITDALLIPRTAIRDTKVAGYNIPEGYWLMCNMTTILRDPAVYEDPDTFKPDRYLTSEGQLLPSDHPMMERIKPQGFGMRYCPGKPFTHQARFEMLVYMLQQYDLTPTKLLTYDDIDLLKQETQGTYVNLSYTAECKVSKRGATSPTKPTMETE